MRAARTGCSSAGAGMSETAPRSLNQLKVTVGGTVVWTWVKRLVHEDGSRRELVHNGVQGAMSLSFLGKEMASGGRQC